MQNAGNVTVKKRQDVTRVTVHKLTATYGFYPSKGIRRKVASFLAEILGLEEHLFYDDGPGATHDGFLIRGLENARRRLSRKFFDNVLHTAH